MRKKGAPETPDMSASVLRHPRVVRGQVHICATSSFSVRSQTRPLGGLNLKLNSSTARPFLVLEKTLSSMILEPVANSDWVGLQSAYATQLQGVGRSAWSSSFAQNCSPRAGDRHLRTCDVRGEASYECGVLNFTGRTQSAPNTNPR